MAFFGNKGFVQLGNAPRTLQEAYAQMIQSAGGPLSMADYNNPDKAALNELVGDQPHSRGGFFKKGGLARNILGNVIGSVGDSLAGNTGYADQSADYRRSMAEAEEYQRRRKEGLEDYETKKMIDERYAAPKERRTAEINGVLVDLDTLQPVWEDPRGRVIPGPDGSFYQLPPLGLGGPAAPAGGPQAGPTGTTLRDQAANAIRSGADPVAVMKRLQELEGGAGQPTGPAGFPRPY